MEQYWLSVRERTIVITTEGEDGQVRDAEFIVGECVDDYGDTKIYALHRRELCNSLLPTP